MTPLIEPGIEPLVDAINELDYAGTVYSCEGHFDLPQSEKFLPTAYVTFGVTDIRRFIALYKRLVELSRIEAETDFRLTYDCVLGRYTLSIWAAPSHREPSQKRSIVDCAVARLSEIVSEFAERSFSSNRDDGEEGALHPCGEPVPPCTLVMPAKEPVCPFADCRA